jgi:hypothetical protein
MNAVGTRALAPVALLLLLVLASVPAAVAKTPARSVDCADYSETSVSPEREELSVELPSPLEAAILSRFSIFRRTALASDQLPLLSPAGVELAAQLVSFYPGYVRQVKVLPDGARYFVVPGFARPHGIPPAGCMPAALRGDRPELVEQEQKLAAAPVYCIIEVGHQNLGGKCESFVEVEESPRVFETGLLEDEPIVELVPDGVASVRATYRAGPPILATVAENVYTLTQPSAVRLRGNRILGKLKRRVDRLERDRRLSKAERRRSLEAVLKVVGKVIDEAAPRRLEWLDAAGGVVRSIAPPSAGAAYLASGAPVIIDGSL